MIGGGGGGLEGCDSGGGGLEVDGCIAEAARRLDFCFFYPPAFQRQVQRRLDFLYPFFVTSFFFLHFCFFCLPVLSVDTARKR